MHDTPNGEVRNRLVAPAVTVHTAGGRTLPLDDYLAELDGGEVTVAWADVTGKPGSFPPDEHTHPAEDVTGLAAVATSGAYGDLSGTPAIPSTPGDVGAAPADHTHTGLMSGVADTVADSTATDVATLIAELNTLLAALRARGVIT